MTHSELVKRAAVWAKNNSAVVVGTEVKAWHCPESPDVIGWKYDGTSVMIECKVSRSDFLTDKHKPWRNGTQVGLGNYRYFAAPAGIIQLAELPEDWGLIEVCGGGMRLRKSPVMQESNEVRERVLLVQMMRYSFAPDMGDRWRQQHNMQVDALEWVR